MANNKVSSEKTQKKKVGFVHKMMFGDENKPDVTPEQMHLSKWGMFKDLFFGRFGTMVALNMLVALFALPAVAVIVLVFWNKTLSGAMIPYSANIGFGYPVVTDAVAQGELTDFTYMLFEFLMLIPGIMFLSLGLSGNMYVMRKLIWGEPTSTIKDFFRGIKKSWLGALVIGLADGLTALLFVFTLKYFDVYGIAVQFKVLSIILSSVLVVFMSLFTAFFMTQNVAFKMRPGVLIRNSVLFILGTNVQAIFFVAVAIAPAFLAFIPNITPLFAILYFFLAFSFTSIVISLFTHHCYEKYLYDKIEGAEAVYSRRKTDIEELREDSQKKKTSPMQYKNPKKRKKSIDEGATITPLMPTFRREDLERLQREHEAVLNDGAEEEREDEEIESDEPLPNEQSPAEPNVGEAPKSAAEGENTENPELE
ncbi:MAG: hypothetical protein J1F39_06540 [Clostridiales bacterium]|nr:hypothetical protein [Clostridiales bacterium]